MAALAGIVEAGLVPKITMPRLTEPSLVFRELIDPVVDRQVYIITRKNEPLSKSAQVMLELLSTALAEPELLLGNQPRWLS